MNGGPWQARAFQPGAFSKPPSGVLRSGVVHRSSSIALEKLVAQRDRARNERDQYLTVIRKLVELDAAPRSIHYPRAWESALQRAREAVTNA